MHMLIRYESNVRILRTHEIHTNNAQKYNAQRHLEMRLVCSIAEIAHTLAAAPPGIVFRWQATASRPHSRLCLMANSRSILCAKQEVRSINC